MYFFCVVEIQFHRGSEPEWRGVGCLAAVATVAVQLDVEVVAGSDPAAVQDRAFPKYRDSGGGCRGGVPATKHAGWDSCQEHMH